VFPSDEKLRPIVEGMASGEKAALRLFIQEVSPTLHALYLRATGQSVAAAVLTERSLEELWRTAPLYDAQFGRPGVWVLSVARLYAVEFVARRRGKEARLKSRPDARPVLEGSTDLVSDAEATLALWELEPGDREFLMDLWHRGLPGGDAGEAARLRLSTLLPEWSETLTRRGRDGA